MVLSAKTHNSNDEFVSLNIVLRKYGDREEETKNLKTSFNRSSNILIYL